MKPPAISLRKLDREVRRYPLVSLISGLSFLVVLGGELLLFLALGQREDILVLHYTTGGINQFGRLGQLVGYGVIGLAIVVMNYLVALELEKRDWFWGKFVAVVTLGFASLLFFSFWAIISVN